MSVVAVLGGGISGVMAAWACLQHGANPVILANKGLASPEGPVFLHQKCGLPLKEYSMQVVYMGKEQFGISRLSELYSSKVYGRPRNVSLGKFTDELAMPIFNASEAIGIVGRLVDFQHFEAKNYKDVEKLLDSCDKVISTIPISVLYPTFPTPYATAYAREDIGFSDVNWMLYNPFPSVEWYRVTNIFGKRYFEFSTIPSSADYFPIKKVDSDKPYVADEPDLLLTGRYGCWDKNCLASDVYYRVLEWMK